MFNEERRDIMKTNMLRNMIIMMIVLLPALVGVVQVYAVTYKPCQPRERRVIAPAVTPMAVSSTPGATFQSTSVYSGQWNQDAQQSTLNADGTVNEEAYGVGRRNVGPRKTEINNPVVDEEDDEGNVPIGDAMLPLLLFACAYLCGRVFLKRKRALKG
jgi:hypothetical protein